MPALDEYLQQKLLLLNSKRQKREALATARGPGVRVVRGGKALVSFSCNDYLGLSQHPRVLAAAKEAIDLYGAGAAASRLVTGNVPLYEQLEAALAEYAGAESACVFGSGYLASIGTIPALVGAGDLILADKLVHACMIDAARLSGATVMRFAHNNMDHCRLLLENNRAEHHHCLILSESVFSMDGDRAPVSLLERFGREFDAWVMVDGAHAISSPPPEGEGGVGGLATYSKPERVATPHPNPPPQEGREFILMGTLSKTLGSYGGYVAGSNILTDYLKTAARSLIFSTGLPPAALGAAIAALEIIKNDPMLTQQPLQRARHFTALLGLPPAQSAIVPLILGANERALAASRLLEERGYLVTAIRPPTVPENTARLRFAFSALHTEEQIETVAAIVQEQGWLCEA